MASGSRESVRASGAPFVRLPRIAWGGSGERFAVPRPRATTVQGDHGKTGKEIWGSGTSGGSVESATSKTITETESNHPVSEGASHQGSEGGLHDTCPREPDIRCDGL